MMAELITRGRLRGTALMAASLFLTQAVVLTQAVAPGASQPQPVQAAPLQLESGALAVQLEPTAADPVRFVLRDGKHGTGLQVDPPFRILLADGTIYQPGTTLHFAGAPAIDAIAPDPKAARRAAQSPAHRLHAMLESESGDLLVEWSLILVDRTSYVRQVLTLTAKGKSVPIERVELLDAALPEARVTGIVAGSPIVAGPLFFGFEHPMSVSRVTGGRATEWIDRTLPLRDGQSVSYSSVIGVTHDGQMRREFLAYLENERAHPYRTFLHYNSWYDLGYFNPYDQAGAVDRIRTFGEELTRKRGVKLDSFLFDDGWDDHASLWRFNKGFPEGFAPLKTAAEQYSASPGVWMSPWGGYDGPKKERIAFGSAAGYEVVRGGYALSGPRYYAAFRDVCLQMIRRYGVNQFKFDGTGNADAVVAGSEFDSDFAAAIHLIGELREARPDLFVNVTTGTWPSPFWLLYADSIWRGGEDDSVAGVGAYRERWITYRDAATYRNVVQAGPLFPLNSLMLHGMIFARHHKELDKDPGNDFRNEVRSYFGTGTQLQEMYITPSLLSASNWDDLAASAQWSRDRQDVLVDTHWIGGDPAWLQVYGWASWSPREGIVVLRNPSDKAQTFSLTLKQAFELPAGAPQRFKATSPWGDIPGHALVQAVKPHVFNLAPFQVLTLEFTPLDRP